MSEIETRNTAYSVGPSSLTVVHEGEVHMLDSTDKRFEKIKGLLQKKPPDIAEALKVMDLKTVITKSSAGRVQISQEGVTFEGKPVSGYMSDRLVAMAGAGYDVKPWMLFMDGLEENPDQGLREDLFKWMEAGKLPLTEDGCIVAFKKVRGDYRDVHSGKFDNSVGQVVSMPRESCDTNRNRTCSTGLHFCSADYLRNFSGQRVMVVKIDPRDVTAIPSDYGNSKGRCCRYEVTGELSKESAARHQVFDEPVMPVDPQEIPDLMANSKSRRATTPGPESPIGKKGSSRKVASNASLAKKAAASAPKTTKKKSSAKKTTTTSKVTKAVSKATKKVSTAAAKITEGLTEALHDVKETVTGTTPKAKRTTVKVSKSSVTGRTKAKAPAKSNAPKTSKVAATTKAPVKKAAAPKAAAKKAPVKKAAAPKSPAKKVASKKSPSRKK